MNKIEELYQMAFKAIQQRAEAFIPTRYPYTYAYDFVRSHHDIVPPEILKDSNGSRSETSAVVERWANSLGLDENDVCKVFADAYMAEYNISFPAEYCHFCAKNNTTSQAFSGVVGRYCLDCETVYSVFD